MRNVLPYSRNPTTGRRAIGSAPAETPVTLEVCWSRRHMAGLADRSDDIVAAAPYILIFGLDTPGKLPLSAGGQCLLQSEPRLVTRAVQCRLVLSIHQA